ncbi:MAG: hypothetical protein EA362_11730 [Saprospirales bacterium]|nr:MAG: hypothetical protein EA362_11730 [Saprospirales bacterium]
MLVNNFRISNDKKLPCHIINPGACKIVKNRPISLFENFFPNLNCHLFPEVMKMKRIHFLNHHSEFINQM